MPLPVRDCWQQGRGNMHFCNIWCQILSLRCAKSKNVPSVSHHNYAAVGRSQWWETPCTIQNVLILGVFVFYVLIFWVAKFYTNSICNVTKSLHWRMKQLTEVYLAFSCKWIIWHEFGGIHQLEESNVHESRAITVETPLHYYGHKLISGTCDMLDLTIYK